MCHIQRNLTVYEAEDSAKYPGHQYQTPQISGIMKMKLFNR